MTMCTPALGWQMLGTSSSSILRTESVKGPVALITHLALTSNSFPGRGTDQSHTACFCSLGSLLFISLQLNLL